jgi:cytochrome c5
MLAACGESLPRNALVSNQATATPELRDACAFTEQKCTRCHTIGRVLAWEAHTRADWEPLVTRMRQMASSGITKADGDVVLRCLGERDAPPQHAQNSVP